MSFWKKLLRLIEELLDSKDDDKKDPDTPETPEPGDDVFDGVTLLGPDIRSWAVTSPLRVRLSGSNITLDYDKANTWEAREEAGATVNANPWVILDYNGKRYAATWEWLRFGQTTKSKRAVHGDHIKRREIPQDWKPRPGERVGFFVSGLIRGRTRNVPERTEIIWITWN